MQARESDPAGMRRLNAEPPAPFADDEPDADCAGMNAPATL